MNKNLFIALVLSIAVYVGWFVWVEKNYKLSDKKQQKAAPTATMAATAPKTETTIQSKTAEKISLAAQPKPACVAIGFRTPDSEIRFNPAGASVSGYTFYGPVSSADLVPVAEPGMFSTMPELLFAVSEQTKDRIVFTAHLSKGVTVEKSYTWNTDGGFNKLSVKIKNSGKTPVEIPQWSITMGPGIGTVPTELAENPKEWKAAYVVEEEGKKHPVLKNLKKEAPAKHWLWAGLQNRYFLAAIVPDKWESSELGFSETKIGKNEAPQISFPIQKSILSAGETKTWETNFYLGPKDYRKLQSLGRGLDRSVEFGFFSQLGKLALRCLYFNFKLTNNYGWAIILLTIFVQILLSPLTYKSTKAMILMKKLQPQMQALQTKYKSDPQRLNTEMMELYRKHGANPLGGCLPMLLQIPIFFALFTALRNSWDLHGSSFIWWIRDLSSKDPYYVLPIVMGIIMFVQQKMTTASAGDATQNEVLKWMPVIFTFMFLSFPSGLVLYWLTSSIIGFLQNLYLQKKLA